MKEFEALIASLGEHIVTYIGRDNLRRVDVFGDEADTAAHVEIFLADDSWSSQTAAIEKMVEVRAMFINEISLDYRFLEFDSQTAEAAQARQSDFSLSMA